MMCQWRIRFASFQIDHKGITLCAPRLATTATATIMVVLGNHTIQTNKRRLHIIQTLHGDVYRPLSIVVYTTIYGLLLGYACNQRTQSKDDEMVWVQKALDGCQQTHRLLQQTRFDTRRNILGHNRVTNIDTHRSRATLKVT